MAFKSSWDIALMHYALPISIDILEILKSKKSFLAHFLSKSDFFLLDDAKLSKF